MKDFMDLTHSIKLINKERELIFNGIENLSDEQLLIIPEAHKNNILWNLGHIIVVQQLLHYMLSKLEMHVSKEFVSDFRTGTSPDIWKQTPDIKQVKSLFMELPDKFLEEYKGGLFKEFRPYKTSTGVELNSFDEAIAFNHFHEGTHAGIILNLKKLV
jgi:hypothetical protein